MLILLIPAGIIFAKVLTFTESSIDSTRSTDCYLADVDSDGDMDAVSAYFNGDDVYWHENDGSENFTKNTIDARIYGKLPKQKFIYLHTLPAKTFNASKKIKHQFVSLVAVKPIRTEKIKVKDYHYLLRTATKDETNKWVKKYGK